MKLIYYLHGFFMFFLWSIIGLFNHADAMGKVASMNDCFCDEMEEGKLEEEMERYLYE